ncbi:MAG: 2,3-bisphosphoglycerate-independent phosphoglycerate mutase [archaeon]
MKIKKKIKNAEDKKIISASKKVVLVILDGIGSRKEDFGNAFNLAKKPNLDNLFSKYPTCKLGASEEYVGLPPYQIGSSEIGHYTIGAGKINDSEIVQINKAIKNKSFFKNKILIKEFNKIKKNQSLHLIGLLSDGGVHSHINHLFAILDLAKKQNIKNIYLHLFMDGRDTFPKSGFNFLKKLESRLHSLAAGKICTISGRYFAMDRDNRWNRLEKAYNAIVYASPLLSESPEKYILNSYKRAVSDEFIEPVCFNKEGIIKNNDTILFFNFRSDRAREFTRAFVDKSFKKFKTKKLNVNFISLTSYDSSFKNVKVVFPQKATNDGLGQIFSKLNYKQLRIAETEKYAHVTYFFNLGQEFANKQESRILINSQKVATYDLAPEMQARQITDKLISNLNANYKFILVNFANGDMVGHTGNLEAAIKAIEVIDNCIGRILKEIDLKKTVLIITADHGNCDLMINSDNSINTAHSLSKVSFCLITNDCKKYKLNCFDKAGLSNIAPTVLKLLDLKIPKYMNKPLI